MCERLVVPVAESLLLTGKSPLSVCVKSADVDVYLVSMITYAHFLFKEERKSIIKVQSGWKWKAKADFVYIFSSVT